MYISSMVECIMKLVQWKSCIIFQGMSGQHLYNCTSRIYYHKLWDYFCWYSTLNSYGLSGLHSSLHWKKSRSVNENFDWLITFFSFFSIFYSEQNRLVHLYEPYISFKAKAPNIVYYWCYSVNPSLTKATTT